MEFCIYGKIWEMDKNSCRILGRILFRRHIIPLVRYTLVWLLLNIWSPIEEFINYLARKIKICYYGFLIVSAFIFVVLVKLWTLHWWYSLVAYGSGKRMVTGTRAGSRIKTENFKRRLLSHHMSQRRDIWCTNSPVISCFNSRFVDRFVLYEAKQRRVKFRRCFGNIPLAAGNVSVTNIGSSGTEQKAPVTDYRNCGSGNHTRG